MLLALVFAPLLLVSMSAAGQSTGEGVDKRIAGSGASGVRTTDGCCGQGAWR